MLDGYVSEKEQLEQIKKWWHENGKFIAIAIVVGLFIGLGWRYWHTMQIRYAENAAMIYQSVVQADSQNNTTTAQGGAKILMEKFSRSPYASLSALLWAKEAAAQNDLKTALSKLQWVITRGRENRLKQMARLSAARIFLAQNNFVAAANELKIVNDAHFQPLIDWVKGDIDAKQGDAEKAKAHYLASKNAFAGFQPAVDLLNKKIAQPF